MFSLFPSTLVSGPESVNRVTRRCKRRQGGRLRRTAIQATITLAAAVLAMLTMLVTLAALAVPAMAATASLQVAGPRFETGPCPFPPGVIPPGVRVDCGNLIVPGDRARADSSSVSLAVAIIRSPNPAPAPDPILFLADGPGGGGLDWLTYFVTSAPDLRADRDIILLDQRGTGYSLPSLRCFEFDSLERAARARQLSLAQTQDLDLQTAAACHDRLAAAGVQLSAYTTGAAAADIKDLRLALGYLEWNLYGLGYGSRLALTVLRDYPDGVRSVVLDSAQPPQVAGWETAAANANRAFNALFVACGLQPACNAAYPGLGLKFAEAVDRLKATPVSVQVLDPLTGSPSPVLFTGQTLIAGVARALADGRQGLVPYLPLAITQLDAGSAAMAEGFATSLSAGPDLMHSGLWYSVQCHDEAPLNDRARIQADANAFPRFRDFILSDTTLAICPGWGAGQADSKESRPVRSDVPALVLAGEYDPLQPPVWSQLAASTLQHSIYYLLPGVGHGASLQGCGQVLVVQFMADPNLAPKPPLSSATPT